MILLLIFPATIANSGMYANRAAAFRASPFCFFVLKKLACSNPSYVFKILDHAHPVFGPVSFIQMLQTPTGKLFTLETKSCLGLWQELTCFDFAFQARNRFINVLSSTTRTLFSFSQIRHAKAAIHPAGGNERRFS